MRAKYAACVCALALLILSGCGLAGGVLPTPAAPLPTLPPETPDPTAAPEVTPPPVRLAETEDMGQEYLDKIVFYGDSNTNALRLQEILPGGYATTQVWTPMSGTLTLNRWDTDGVVYPETWTEMPVTEAMALKKPVYLIVNVGANGVSFMDEAYFKSEYSEMIAALKAASPDTKIICSSLFPVADSYPNQSQINNAKLAEASRWIYEVAAEQGVRYMDSASAVRNENGALPENLHIGDGYHLNGEAHRMVLKYIRTHGYR